MTDPNTPPTVGQPVAEETQLSQAIEKALRELQKGSAIQSMRVGVTTLMEAICVCPNEFLPQYLLDRLAQARSAPPSEGMGIVIDVQSANEALHAINYYVAALEMAENEIAAAHWKQAYADIEKAMKDAVQKGRELSALAAPSGGPDVE